MARNDIRDHERLVALNIVLTREPNAAGLYTATPHDLAGNRVPGLAYQARNPHAAVQGAVRGMLR